MRETVTMETRVAETTLPDLWEESRALSLDSQPLELLQYRSNLLGADLRITNFGGGNTSSKFELPDPLSGKLVRVMAVKGSGGDLRSIGIGGFAVLDLDKLEQLASRYRGEEHEDEMVAYYPLCAFGGNRVATSIDTPLHAFLPFPHVDHLHPDSSIAIAASANGKAKLDEFNRRYGRRIVWVPWQRPGFELAMMLRRAVEANPDCEGILLASHGLFTWGDTQRGCYANSILTITQMGEFIEQHANPAFGGPSVTTAADPQGSAIDILPFLRGAVSSQRRAIAHYENSKVALEFANSQWAEQLCALGTSCPDHFLRTRICPMFVAWNPATEGIAQLERRIERRVVEYRASYADYYKENALPDSPKLRDANPSVVVIAGLGVFGFGKDKREARTTTEFFVNAIHVMAGANALAGSEAGFRNYVALPRREAFRIEYWALEDAKLQRMPPEREFSRRIFFVAGGGSGIGREVALLIAGKGGHVVVADRDFASAEAVSKETGSAEMTLAYALDLTSRQSVRSALRAAVLKFGGVDAIINTAAVYPTPAPGTPTEDVWMQALQVNVTGNFVLAEEAAAILKA
jgi:rhamnulose-1-phosphate aldolase/alcohol dehydrogenase